MSWNIGYNFFKPKIRFIYSARTYKWLLFFRSFTPLDYNFIDKGPCSIPLKISGECKTIIKCSSHTPEAIKCENIGIRQYCGQGPGREDKGIRRWMDKLWKYWATSFVASASPDQFYLELCQSFPIQTIIDKLFTTWTDPTLQTQNVPPIYLNN